MAQLENILPQELTTGVMIGGLVLLQLHLLLFQQQLLPTGLLLQVWLLEIIEGNVVTRNETICDDSGEDPTFSRSVYGISVAYHLECFDITLHADSRLFSQHRLYYLLDTFPDQRT